MQQLALNELKEVGYTEDRASRWAFESRYLWFHVPGIILGIGIFPLTFHVWSPFTDFFAQFLYMLVCFFIGFSLCLGAATHANRSIPISKRSGEPMQVFLRSDPPEDTTEYLYVDRDSRTYFTRLISRRNYG